jgi:tRNA A-37 threonylcarbamoyl transferase component Bud32
VSPGSGVGTAREARLGSWRAQLLGAGALADALVEHALVCAGAERIAAERMTIEGVDLYFKGTPFPRRARLRHALRSRVLRRPLPRLCEATNLGWLRAHDFGAPEPLAAGALWKGNLPRYQFLATRWEQDGEPLRGVLASASPAQRDALTTSLARDIARLHALRFVHRDLYPRNLLVGTVAGRYRPIYLDAWRGGARAQLRGATWDLACLFLEGTSLWSLDEQAEFFANYVETRRAHGRAISARRLLADVARERVVLELRARRESRADLAPIDVPFDRAALLERVAPRH